MSLFNNPFDPAREAALVTGAGNGIGRAIAQALIGEGVRTVFADVNRDTVTAAVSRLAAAGTRACPGSAISRSPPPATRCWRMRRPRSGR